MASNDKVQYPNTPAPKEDGTVLAKKVKRVKSQVLYESIKTHERKFAGPGDDISDMGKEDLEHFTKQNLIEEVLIEV